jgi:acyl-CoA thioesterase FadM
MTPMAFTHETTVRLYDTDAAGRLFFGALFRLVQEALEEFMAREGVPVGDVIAGGEFLYPVVRVEADYLAPLAVGERVRVEVTVARVGRRSFTLRYRVAFADGREAANAQVVHAVIGAASGAPAALPGPLREILERHA